MYPIRKGTYAPQAHVGIPEGTYEEEHGRKGFYGKSAHLYHTHPPTGWIRFEGKLRPHLFRLEQAGARRLRRPRRHAGAVSGQSGRPAVRIAALAAHAVLFPQRRWRRTDLRASRQRNYRDRFRASGLRAGRLPGGPARRNLPPPPGDTGQLLSDRPIAHRIRAAGQRSDRPSRAVRPGRDRHPGARPAPRRDRRMGGAHQGRRRDLEGGLSVQSHRRGGVEGRPDGVEDSTCATSAPS